MKPIAPFSAPKELQEQRKARRFPVKNLGINPRGTYLPKGAMALIKSLGLKPGSVANRIRDKGMTFEQAIAKPFRKCVRQKGAWCS